MSNTDPKLRRTHKFSLTFNDYEFAAIEQYCKRHKIKNRANVIRKFIMTQIFVDIDKNYPTLFDKEELDNLK